MLGTLPAPRTRRGGNAHGNDAALRTGGQWQQKLLPLNALARQWNRRLRCGRASRHPLPHRWQRTKACACGAMPTATANRSWWNSLRLWRDLAATGFAAAAFMGIVVVGKLAQPPGPGYMVVWSGRRDKSPGWVVQAGTKLATGAADSARQGGRARRQVAAVLDQGNDWKARLAGSGAPRRIERSVARQTAAAGAQSTLRDHAGAVNGSPLNRPTGPILFIGGRLRLFELASAVRGGRLATPAASFTYFAGG